MTSCPICSIAISDHSRGKALHARMHGMTSEEFYRLLNGLTSQPTCSCSAECLARVRWRDWKRGYTKYARGHNVRDMNASNSIEALHARIKSGEIKHWSKGKTKETDSRIQAAARKTSKTLMRRFADGSITHWAVGQTSETHASIKQGAKMRQRKYSTGELQHWKKMDEQTVLARIKSALDNRFIVTDGIITVDDRKNNTSHMLTVKCKRCDGTTDRSVYSVIRSDHMLCKQCDRQYISLAEYEMGEFIRTLTDHHVFMNDRSTVPGFELDISIPSLGFAIEHNGLYWHSEYVQYDKSYHDRKSIMAMCAGIRLLHVFEDEWREKKPIVKSMIRHRLNATPTRIYARKCTLTELNSSQASVFFNTNHIDGHTAQVKTFALVFDDVPVACLSLRKPRQQKYQNRFEIARFCTILNTSVVGGLSRLLKHAKTYTRSLDMQGIMTYVDTRLGTDGSSYVGAGMTCVGNTALPFWWTDGYTRMNRFKIRASADTGESQHDVSFRRKAVKIWGCSNAIMRVDV